MNTCCKAVIFDLDGTVLDTLQDLSNAMNHTLASFGFPQKEVSHHRSAIGNGIRKYAQRCIPKNLATEELLDEFVPVAAEDYKNNCMVKTAPFEGVCELLDFLQEMGISINILSNKRNDFVNKLTNHYFPKYRFDCVYGELPGIAKKPDPAAALKIAADCGIDPSNVIIIGDSVYDILAGKNAGMKTIAVTWGYQDRDLLAEHNPDLIADTTEEIIDYLKTLNK